jgi:hypothetical protein
MAEFNYFNFFTEIEEYFWRKRGAHLLVSPMDWAIMETWQRAGIPVEAVQRGIDRAFESYGRSKRGAGRPLKSLAYCVDAVVEAGAEAQEAAAGQGPQTGRAPAREPFTRSELRQYLERNAQRLRAAADASRLAGSPPANSENAALCDPNSCSEGWLALKRHLQESAMRLEELLPLVDSPAPLDLEDLERRLTVLEEKLSASLASNAGEAVLLAIREEMDRSLAPYRRKMDAGQLAQLERQYQQKKLYDEFRIPRLSLFYLI